MIAKPTSVNLTPNDLAWLKETATERACSVSAVVRWLIRKERREDSTRRTKLERRRAAIIEEIQTRGDLVARAKLHGEDSR
jgi:hypothetical protein